MGTHSTLRVSRAKALEIYRRLVVETEPTNDQLEQFLDLALNRAFFNAVVTDFEASAFDEAVANRWARLP